MPSSYRRPGTFVEEVLLPQQIQALGLDVSLGAFAGRTERGPVGTATFISSWTEYARMFGAFKDSDGEPYWMTYAVYQFFGNGGRGAYVTRAVSDDALAARLILNDGTSSPQDVLVVSASSPGDWAIASPNGSGLAIRVDESTPRINITQYRVDNGTATLTTAIPHGYSVGDVFNLEGISADGLSGEFAVSSLDASPNILSFAAPAADPAADTPVSGAYLTNSNELFALTVFYNGATNGYLVEKFNDLSLDPASDRYAISVVNGQSKYLVLSRPANFVAPSNGSTSVYRAPGSTQIAVGLAKPSTVTVLPAVTITEAAIGTSGLISYTAAGQELSIGDTAVINGVSVTLPGGGSLNGSFTVSGTSGDVFSVSGHAIQSNVIAKVSLSIGGAVRLSSAHQFSVSDKVVISGTGDNNFDTDPRTITAVTQSSTLIEVSASDAGGSGNTITVSAGDADSFWVGQFLSGVTSASDTALNTGSYVTDISGTTITLNDNAIISGSSDSVASVTLHPALQFGSTLTDPGSYSAVSDALVTFTLDAVTGLSGSVTGTHTVATPGSLDGSAIGKTELISSVSSFGAIGNNLVFNLPDAANLSASDARAVYSSVISTANDRGDSFVVLDTPANLDPAEAQSFAADVSPKSSNAALYYPWVNIADPASSGGISTRSVPPGGSVVGLYLATDASRGVFKAPAGLGTGLNNIVTPARSFSSYELDALNTALTPVNVIRQVPGSGICVMGARNVGNDRRMKYVSTRRTMLQVKKRLVDVTAFAVFENNDPRLWEQLRLIVGTYLRELWQQGGLKGARQQDAFYVKCDSTNNTPMSIADGELNIEVGVALQTPAEFVIIRIGQFDGATSITVQ